jgi:hypothetical protein
MLPRPVREAEERANRIHQEVYGNTAPAAPAPTPDEPDPAVIAREPAAPAPTPEPTPAPAPAVDTWEEKYRVLEGKYRAEVPRLSRDLREATAAIQELREQLAVVSAAPAPVPAAIEGMTPEQVVEQFGEDFAKAVGAVAERIAQGKVEACAASSSRS